MERRSDRELPAFHDALTDAASAAFSVPLPDDERVWRADGRVLAYRDWGQELVVYHEPTGHTHHLGPLGRAVLLVLLDAQRGLRMSEIVPLLCVVSDKSPTAASAIEHALLDLATLELVSCTPG